MGEAWHRQLVKGSGCGWQWLVLVVDGAQDGARAKDRAVAQGMIFGSKTHHLLVTKLHFDHTHHHQNAQSNSSSHINSSCVLS